MNIEKLRKNPLNALGCVMLLITLVVTVAPFLRHNDYFVDEAMLANSLFTRDMASLGASPLDYSQSAPLGYLYLVKVLTLAFGGSTTVTRLPSLLAIFLLLLFTCKIAKELLGLKYPLVITGFAAINTNVLHYAANFKQYTLEAFLALLCLYCMGLYYKKRLGIFPLCLVFAVVLWFSFSSIFFIFGILLVILIYTIRGFVKKEITVPEFIKILGALVIPAVSVLANLVIWVLPGASNIGPRENEYWSGIAFPLIPTRFSDLVLIARMGKRILVDGMGYFMAFPFIAALMLFFRNIKTLFNKCVSSIIVAFAAILIASYFGKYPIETRLLLFVYPLAYLFIWYMMEQYVLTASGDFVKCYCLAFCAVVLINAGVAVLLLPSSSVYSQEQLSYGVDYVEKNAKPGDGVWMYYGAIPEYNYLTGYNHSFTDFFLEDPVQMGDVMFGSIYLTKVNEKPYSYEYVSNPVTLKKNVDLIVQYETTYLLFAHHGWTACLDILPELARYGTVELVNEAYDTPVYKFVRGDAGR